PRHLSVMRSRTDEFARREIQRQGEAAGAAKHAARKDRADFRCRPADEVRDLRKLAATTAAVCGDCFQPPAPPASVTLVFRVSENVPARYNGIGQYLPPRTLWADVPICITCWLIDVEQPEWTLRGCPVRPGGGTAGLDRDIRRHRCEGCGR